jgi:hypothetical protein
MWLSKRQLKTKKTVVQHPWIVHGEWQSAINQHQWIVPGERMSPKHTMHVEGARVDLSLWQRATSIQMKSRMALEKRRPHKLVSLCCSLSPS